LYQVVKDMAHYILSILPAIDIHTIGTSIVQ